jgi:hypothetical protein
LRWSQSPFRLIILTYNTCIFEFNNIITLLIWMDNLYIIHLKDPYIWIGTRCNTIHLFQRDCNNVVAFQCWFWHFEVVFGKMKVIRCLDATTNLVLCGLNMVFPFQFMFFWASFLKIFIFSRYINALQIWGQSPNVLSSTLQNIYLKNELMTFVFHNFWWEIMAIWYSCQIVYVVLNFHVPLHVFSQIME